jgi:hypothetical protein
MEGKQEQGYLQGFKAANFVAPHVAVGVAA